jgi:hypothetical protein
VFNSAQQNVIKNNKHEITTEHKIDLHHNSGKIMI